MNFVNNNDVDNDRNGIRCWPAAVFSQAEAS